MVSSLFDAEYGPPATGGRDGVDVGQTRRRLEEGQAVRRPSMKGRLVRRGWSC
jgi:hypothetical protein